MPVTGASKVIQQNCRCLVSRKDVLVTCGSLVDFVVRLGYAVVLVPPDLRCAVDSRDPGTGGLGEKAYYSG
ncbi:hypothetical protein MRX96_057604 [Rhipicephalus microplus]